MAIGKDKDDEDQFDGVAEGADNQSDGVAEGADDPTADKAAKKQDNSKGFGKGRVDKTKQDDTEEDQSLGTKSKGSRK